MWWAWAAYAWLTSVVDPEEGSVRLALFAAMAAPLVVALSVREAFGDAALLFQPPARSGGPVLVGYEAIRFAEPRGAAAPAAAPRGRDGVAQPASRSTNQRARPRMRAAG